MSNPLIQMRQLREQQRQLEEAIRNLENNPQLKAELEFETEFRALLSKHGKTLEEAVQVMDPDLRLVTSAVLEGRKLRAKRRTPEATQIYRANTLKNVPGVDPESLHAIYGPAVVFLEKVWP
jgi:2,3-bisphosphoglycerate-independent phosphoglycerate mutase